MRPKRRVGRKRVAEKSPRPPRRTGWVELSEEDRRRAQAEDEEANRRGEASFSLVRLRATPGLDPERRRRDYGALLEKMSALLKKAVGEKRVLTVEEASEWDRIDTELVALQAESQKYEKVDPAASALRERMCALINLAEQEKRDFTPEEIQEWDRMEADLVARKADVRTHVEIDRLASAIRDQLDKIDDTRWRCSPIPVRRKIAEELFNVFVLEIQHARRWHDGIRSLQTERDAYLKAARILAKAPRISDEAEEFGFHRGLPALADLKHHALLLSGRVNWFLQFRHRALYRHTARYLDRLVLRLAVILTHTTKLNKYRILGEVLPGVLDTAWQFYPDLAPRRGAADPLTRYKRDMKYVNRSLVENRFLRYREALFKNDDRFPALLFQPHRPKRTVDHQAPTKAR